MFSENTTILQQLYSQCFTAPLKTITPLTGSGSNRQYFRLVGQDAQSCIGVIGESRKENESFIYLTQHFTKKSLPVPEILAVSEDRMSYLQTDLGSKSLFEALRTGRESQIGYTTNHIELLKKTICLLPAFQVKGIVDLNTERLLPPTRFDVKAAMFDLYYFKYCFLKVAGLPFDEIQLEADLLQLGSDLNDNEQTGFLYRDFQARNVMLVDGNPYFIDYQGGREGPLEYDVASFLWQASAHYGADLRTILLEEYLSALEEITDIDRQKFLQRLDLFVFFRTLQVLGAYGLRGYVEHKPHFLASIPLAIANLREALQKGVAAAYPYLSQTLEKLVQLPQFQLPTPSPEPAKQLTVKVQAPTLVVRIFSFSYKKGIPEDTSGNGGGYVFDCRSTHNPGRYEPYKKLTGLDAPVIRFLETNGEILPFLQHVYALADFHVQRYLDRGFTALMFSFGCTGGQHRSVYSAQHLAEHLSEKFGIEIILQHREQAITQHFPAKAK